MAIRMDGKILAAEKMAELKARTEALAARSRVPGLAVILVFIGAKMTLIDIYKIPVAVSLGVVVAILAVTMLLSARTAPGQTRRR